MNVLYASDDNYAPILSVSISSLCKHNSNLKIVVVDNGISNRYKKLINDIVLGQNNEIKFVQGENIAEQFDFLLNMDRGSMSQFSRLFLNRFVPEEWDRVLYLDCDTLIRESLEDLYQMNLQGQIVGGVEDAFSKHHWKKLGLDKKTNNINSGVMLIDLNKWHNQKIEEQFIKYIIEKKGRILQGDQGIINAVLNKKIYCMSPKYNMVTYNYDFKYKEMQLYRRPYKYYSEYEIEKAKNEVVIIHFTSSFASMRPWEQEEINHPYAGEWNEYFVQLGLERKYRDKKLSCKFFELLPRKFFLFCIGILHSYVIPIFFR